MEQERWTFWLDTKHEEELPNDSVYVIIARTALQNKMLTEATGNHITNVVRESVPRTEADAQGAGDLTSFMLSPRVEPEPAAKKKPLYIFVVQ